MDKSTTSIKMAADTASISSAAITSASTTSSTPSLSSASSILPGVFCTPCFRGNKTVGAVKYCVDCTENYCKPCLRTHIKSNASKAHALVGMDEMPDFAKNSVIHGDDVGLDKCPKHVELDLDNYCEQHHVLCCDKCAYLEHGSCDHIIDLITATKEIDLDKEMSETQERLKELITNLTSSVNKRQGDQVRTRQNTADSLGAIREFRNEINAILDKLQRVPIDVINNTCLEEDNGVNDDVRGATGLIEQLQECNKKLRVNACPVTTKFAVLVKAKEIEKKAECCQHSISKKSGKDLNIFAVNKKVIETIKNIKSIGDLKSGAVNLQIDFKGYVSMREHDGTGDDDKTILTDKADICDTDVANDDATDLTDKSTATESAGNPQSNKASDIQGITQLADGRFVVADNEQRHLLIVSNDLIFEKKIVLGNNTAEIGEPFGVCRTGTCQIAVTMTRDKVVRLIDVDSAGADTVSGREIGVGEYCRGVAYSFLYDELFVVCGGGSYKDEGLGHVRVFDLQGNHLRSLKRSSTGGNLPLPHPLNIAVSPDGRSVHVTDLEKGVVTFDRYGDQVAYLGCPGLQVPSGICLDRNGSVIVTFGQSNDLVQVSTDGKESSVLTTGTSILQRPQALCFDERKSRLIVSMASTDRLAVFNVN